MHKLIILFIIIFLSGCVGQQYKQPTSLNIAKLRFYVTPSVAARSSIVIRAFEGEKCNNDRSTTITTLGSRKLDIEPIANGASGGVDVGVPKSPDSTYQKNNYVEITIEADKAFHFGMVTDNGKILKWRGDKHCYISAKFTPQTDKTYEVVFNSAESEESCSLLLSEIKVIDGLYRQLNVTGSGLTKTHCYYSEYGWSGS
jgi:hypothetical protein